jgi:hypothetical protein
VKEQILNKLKEDELAKKETIKEEEKKIEETPVLDSTDNQLKKMRDSTRITDIKAIEAAVMQFYQDKGAYPSSIEDFV